MIRLRLYIWKIRKQARLTRRWCAHRLRAVLWQIKRRVLRNREEPYQRAALAPLLHTPINSYSLSTAEIARFQQQGMISPLPLCSAEDMSLIRRYVRDFTLTAECPVPGYPHTKWRHINDAVIYHLGTHAAILDRVSQLLGDNILLWQSNLFDKPPGADEIPWHQDRLFLELEEGTNVSAWIALDDVDTGNACVQVIPGSHHQIIAPANPDARYGSPRTAFGRMADPEQIDATTAVNIELRAGEFMLFDQYLLHRSGRNSSNRQRLGLALRYTTPEARVSHQLEGYHCLLVRGKDTARKNRIGLSPVSLIQRMP